MQIYRGISTRTKLASKQLLLFSTLTAAILLLATTTLLFLKPTQTAKAIAPPDSCFAFDAAAGRIVDYGDVITNETEPNSANSRTIGSCATSLEIPSTIGGVAVVAIGDGAFQGNSITSVTIPDSVNMIAGSAFRSNQLATLTIPESVTYVGTHSFRGNRLTHIDILPASLSIAGSAFRDNQLDALPEYFTRPGVTSIPDGVFQGNIFTELVVPDNITSIGSYAFNSNKLTSVTLSNSMTSVGGNYTFAYNQITSLVLPGGLKSIGGSYTFYSNKISSLSFPQGFTSISATHAFAYNNISNLNLPDSLLSISNYAFYNNQLESISIPISTSTIGGFAFANNQISNAVIGNPSATMQHTSFVNNPISSMKLGDNTYNGPLPTSHPSCFAISGTNITDYYQASPIVARDSGVLCGLDVLVTDAATSIGDSAFSNNQLKSVIIPDSIISIGASVFTGNQIASLELGSSVTSIGNDAFSGNKLTSLDIPDSVESIGAASFYGNQISSLKLGNSLTNIRYSTFSNNQITSLNIPESLSGIEGYAFSDNKLTSLTIPNTVNSIDQYAFQGNDFSYVNIDMTDIPSRLFSGIQVGELVLGHNVRNVGDRSFLSSGISKITINHGVELIDEWAFQNNNITSVDIPSSVTTIRKYAFSINQLESVVIPSGISAIEEGVFWRNYLKTLVVPNNITDIANAAFNTNSIKTVYIEGNPSINIGSFNINGLDRSTIQQDISIGSSDWYEYYFNNTSLVHIYSDNADFINAQANFSRFSNVTADGKKTTTGVYTINPASYTANYVSKSGVTLLPSLTAISSNPDITDYRIAQFVDNSVPNDPKIIASKSGSLYRIGQTVNLAPPSIPGYLTPSAETIKLTSKENHITFTYYPIVSSVNFAQPNSPSGSNGNTVANSIPSTLSSPLITTSTFAMDEASSNCSTIENTNLLAPGSVVTSQTPSNITILGGLDFTLSHCTNPEDPDSPNSPAKANVIYTLGGKLPTANSLSDLRVYKHSPSTDTVTDITNQVSMTLDPTTNKPIISYELIDGSEWDEDGEVDGIIVDPIYVGVVDYAEGERLASTGNSIWIATILGAALMGVGVVGLRRI